MRMPNNKNWTHWIWGLVCLGLLLSSASVVAQKSNEKSRESEVEREAQQLNQEQERLAREYVDVVRLLSNLTEDYVTYFTKHFPQHAEVHLKELKALQDELQKRDFAIDPKELESELADLQAALGDREDQLRTLDKKTYRLSQSLMGELAALENILEDDLTLHLEQNEESARAFSLYIQDQVNREMQQNHRHETRYVYAPPSPNPIVIVGDDSQAIVYVTPPNPPSTPTPEDVSARAYVPQADLGKGRTYRSRIFVDSMRVTSSKQPIYVSAPIGRIEITGTSGRYVYVHSKIDAAAPSEQKALGYVDKSSLQFCPKEDGICVEMQLPSLQDPSVSLRTSELNVRVPNGNPIVCTNSFGEIDIDHLQSNVKITAGNSRISVTDVTGAIDVKNSMGPVNVEDVTGTIAITNSHAPIRINNCEGTTAINGFFAIITVDECSGELTIRNSGDIDVRRHTGSVQIENQNGNVLVIKVDGNIIANNAFRTTTLEDINGGAAVRNNNGTIEVTNVDGPVDADSHFGKVYATQITGPLTVEGQYADINLVLGGTYDQPTTVNASGGVVQLSIITNSDARISATAVGGTIQSHFPMTYTQDGITRTGDLLLGSASVPIVVTGNNSQIVIKKASR